MNGENLNTGLNTNFSSREAEALSPARIQEIGHKVEGIARHVSFRDEMINKLGQAMQSRDSAGVFGVFREIDRPDQLYQKVYPEDSRMDALGSVTHSLVKDKETCEILETVGKALEPEGTIVHNHENHLVDIYSKYPTVLDFDKKVARHLILNMNFSEEKVRKFEYGAYGEKQLECLDIYDEMMEDRVNKLESLQ
ncbi:MAG: hypothetical protein Q4A33_02765 [Candidatus Saccharibacteria bacterium]|nr:hypothetical protein [Candidatus Saccharibacteria bacterium]